jgi:hypothetical protein
MGHRPLHLSLQRECQHEKRLINQVTHWNCTVTLKGVIKFIALFQCAVNVAALKGGGLFQYWSADRGLGREGKYGVIFGKKMRQNDE